MTTDGKETLGKLPRLDADVSLVETNCEKLSHEMRARNSEEGGGGMETDWWLVLIKKVIW